MDGRYSPTFVHDDKRGFLHFYFIKDKFVLQYELTEKR